MTSRQVNNVGEITANCGETHLDVLEGQSLELFRLGGPVDIGHDSGPNSLEKINLPDLGLVLLSLDVFGHLL